MSKDVLPALRFALREYRLYINLATLECLNNPVYIEMLYEDARKFLVITGSCEKSKHSIQVTDRTYDNADNEYYISRRALTEAFRVRMNWSKKKNYRVTGELSQHAGLVVFDLKQAAAVD